jgi:hypothetical protein
MKDDYDQTQLPSVEACTTTHCAHERPLATCELFDQLAQLAQAQAEVEMLEDEIRQLRTQSRAEVERLTLDRNGHRDRAMTWSRQVNKALAVIDEFRAELTDLRRLGDAMAYHVECYDQTGYGWDDVLTAVKDYVVCRLPQGDRTGGGR